MTADAIRRVAWLVRGSEVYVWLFTPDQARAALRSVHAAAANRELSFDETDAAIVARQIRSCKHE